MPNYQNINGRNGTGGGKRNTSQEQARAFFATKTFKKDWIQKGADEEMVEYAEVMGKYMAKPDTGSPLTNSQIRNVYGEIKRIQMKGYEQNHSSFLLLKPKMAYAAGRQDAVGLKLLQEIFNAAYGYVNTEETFKNFCNFMEAVLAYHKAYGGK